MIAFSTLSVPVLNSTGNLRTMYDMANAKAWGQHQPRTAAEIDRYCNTMLTEAETTDFYLATINHDGI